MQRGGKKKKLTWVFRFMKNGTQDPDHSGGTSNIIQQMAGLSSFTSAKRFNDPDFIEIEWYNSETETKTQLGFWALFAAPFVVATDPRQEHVRRFLKNKDVIAINQDALVEAGDLRIGHGAAGQVWSRKLSNGWAVLVYNANVHDWSASVVVEFPLNASVLRGLSSSSSPTFTIFEVWTQKVEGKAVSEQFSAGKLAPKESKLYLITLIN